MTFSDAALFAGRRITWLLLLVLAAGCASHHKRIRLPVRTDYSVADPAFTRSISQLLEAPLLPGNKITTLLNGAQGFPAMIEAIQSATNSIDFENFIWRHGHVSDRFIDALAERARAGVKIRLTLDALGSSPLRRSDYTRLRESGIKINRHNAPTLFSFVHINQRTHRRLLIIDGRIGFIGGLAIADTWEGEDPRHWRDNHYRVEGPVVAQLQAVFCDNWINGTGELLHGDSFFPDLRPAGPMNVQCFRSGPRDASENARLNHLYFIASARKSIRLGQGYFIPDRMLTEALVQARQRGVRVEIIVPAHPNLKVVQRASRARWGPLLEAGVHLYEFQPSRYHCKLMAVDDLWISAGSINFDNRSSSINDEANLNVLDADFAAQQIELFERDKANSREVTLEAYKARPWLQKCLDRWSTLFQSQL